ncbi:hypothetical protein MMC25_004286 [Agyrium rufum]|nr:hypothetical protein [Agyrium rufum]
MSIMSVSFASVPLSLIPTALDCLAWSEDGELAVAAGETVRILLPNRRRKPSFVVGRGMVVDPWIQVTILVNQFTEAEWRFSAPGSLRSVSIGQEQSNSTVAALTWSPPGLASYGRSCLTILTTNTLLSIWSPGGDPESDSSWTRVMVINENILDYNLFQPPLQEPSRESMQIRAFAWSKISPARIGAHIPFALLVVSDGASNVYITQFIFCWRQQRVQAESTFHMPNFSDETSWGTENSQLRQIRSTEEPLASLITSTLNSRDHHHSVRWSAWCLNDEGLYIWISYISGGMEYSIRNNYDISELNKKSIIRYQDATPQIHRQIPRAKMNTILKASPSSCSGVVWGQASATHLHLTWILRFDQNAFSLDRIDDDTHDQSKPQVKTVAVAYPTWLGEEGQPDKACIWDRVSGICAIPVDRHISESDTGTDIRVCYATHLGTYNTFGMHLPHQLSIKRGPQKIYPLLNANRTSSLQEQILHARMAYGKTNGLNENVMVKIWGLTRLDNLIVCCISLHPSDRIEYVIPSSSKSILLFSSVAAESQSPDQMSGVSTSFPWEVPVTCKSMAKAYAPVIKFAARYMVKLNAMLDGVVAIMMNMATIVLRYQAADRLWYNFLQVWISYGNQGTVKLQEDLRALHETPLRERSHQRVFEICDQIADLAGVRARCIFCNSELMQAAHNLARCGNDHFFERCSLTMLPILEPAVSKWCEDCDAVYLKDSYIRDRVAMYLQEDAQKSLQEATKERVRLEEGLRKTPNPIDWQCAEDESLGARELPFDPVFPRALFHTFSRCIFCGGNFVTTKRRSAGRQYSND